MNGSWIAAGEIRRTLEGEASRVAGFLGHRMTAWVSRDDQKDTYMSRCVTCSDSATIVVRRFRQAPIAGPATVLRCPGRR